MTLSLDDVRNKRFRMARKSGYEVLEVDEFVDEVEASFDQLIDENVNLKRQVESLKSAPPAPAAGPGVQQAPQQTPSSPRGSESRPARGHHRQGGQRGGGPAGRDVHRAGGAPGGRGHR